MKRKKLGEAFPLWSKNAEYIITNEEDRLFLKSMKTNWIATFGSFDKILAEKKKRKFESQRKEKQRAKKHREELKWMGKQYPIQRWSSQT